MRVQGSIDALFAREAVICSQRVAVLCPGERPLLLGRCQQILAEVRQFSRRMVPIEGKNTRQATYRSLALG